MLKVLNYLFIDIFYQVRKVNQSFCTKSTKEEKKVSFNIDIKVCVTKVSAENVNILHFLQKREKNIKSDLLEFYNCEKKKAEKVNLFFGLVQLLACDFS